MDTNIEVINNLHGQIEIYKEIIAGMEAKLKSYESIIKQQSELLQKLISNALINKE